MARIAKPDCTLGFGCMRFPLLDESDPKSIDMEHLERMVDAFMEAGGTYFDTAFVYHGGASEGALRRALVERYPREAYTVATKCLAWTAPDAQTAKTNLATSLERLGLDYVDYYLLHNLGAGRTDKYEEYGMWDFVRQKKEEGLARNVGFSLHDDADVLESLLKAHPWVDFVQLQVNYLDWENPVVQARRCMEVAQRHDVPVIVMEPARGGRLARLPERAARPLREARPDASLVSWAYRFCRDLPNVVAVLSGMSSEEQVRQNMAEYLGLPAFSDAERAALDEARSVLAGMADVPCTNCGYCMKGCPEGVMIPEIMSMLNLEAMTEDRAFAKEQYSWRAAAGLASKCVACGSCEAICPQRIDIVDMLALAAERFER